MAVDEQSRHQLYQRLEVVLGEEATTTLMEHLPPIGWADVATKADLDNLRAATKTDLDNLRAATKTDIDNLRAATKTDIDNLRDATKTDIDNLRDATKTDIDNLRVATKTDIDNLRVATKVGMENLGNALTAAFHREFAGLHRDLRNAVFSLTGAGVGIAGVTLALSRFSA
jgi:hypothetical protein